MPKDQQDLIATPEAAAILHKDPRTVQRQASAGDLSTVSKLPGKTGAYLFDRGYIEALAEERQLKSA